MNTTLASFTDALVDEICNSQPLSLSSSIESRPPTVNNPCDEDARVIERPPKGTGQRGQFRSTEEIDSKYRDVFSYPYFNLVQSGVIEDAVYSDKSIVVCAPTGSGKTVVFEMAIVQLLMELEDKQYTDDFKIIYMAPVKALCTERLTEWYPKFTRLGLLCIEVTGDTDVDFTQLKPYKIIITTPEKWDMLTRRWRDHRGLVEVIKLFLIDEVHILNDETRGPVLEAVVSRMKTIENSAQSVHRIEQLRKEMQGLTVSNKSAPRIRFVAVSATVSNPEDVANWLGTSNKPAVFYKFGDECRPVKLKRIVEGYPCAAGTSIFKFDIILNYKLWPIIQKYHSGKPTLIFCNTRKSVVLTAETLSRELTISFNAEQKAKLTALASSIKNKKLQALVMSGVGCHHAGLLYEERQTIEFAFRNRDLPILITTTTLAMGVNLPAHLVIVKNTQQYVKGAYQEYSISTVLQMVGRAGRPQFDTEATAVIMTRLVDKPRYQALVGGCEPLQSFLHKRLAENLNSEAALGTVGDVAQCVQWLRSTFLYVRAARDPKRYLGLTQNSPQQHIAKKIEELCVKAMNGLASSGLITMDEASCIESTEAGRLMSIFYLDLETMKQIMKIEGTESLERLLVLICESHELADMHLRVDERRCLNLLNRNNAAATIRFPMKGKISTRQMKLNCVIQAVLGCLSIPDPSLNQEALKIMRIADRVCKCLVTYVTRPDLISQQPQFYSAVLNSILLAKCVAAHLWENSTFVSKQLKGIGPTFSTLLASAGKVNFVLLEESHPRDLERIMNKGPPAGNVLRKQVSLLPKYQLTMIPVDEKTVAVQLALLNQAHLAENMENLTAGDSHKNYIIVGDSNNNVLLLVAFKDRDLISVFDGTITHQVRRKHNFEHKIFAHCVSSTFVGIDVQSEYLFNDVEPLLRAPARTAWTPAQTNAIPTKKSAERQTCITDTFKERKRKINPDAIEKSKEKRKRENAMIENFKYLKQSFETASKNISQSLRQQSRQNGGLLNKNADACSNNTMSSAPKTVNTISTMDNTCYEEMDSDDFIDEEKIDSILNEIENEMGKSNTSLNLAKTNTNPYFSENTLNVQNPFSTKLKGLKNMSNENSTTKSSSYKALSAPRKLKPKTPKSNYTFIELLERNLSISDDEEKAEVTQKDNGFSDTIKNQIQKYLTKTLTKTSVPNRSIKMLLDNPEHVLPTADEKAQKITQINQDSEIINSPMHIYSPYPRYEIKEILGGKNITRQNSNKQPTKDEENLIFNQDSKDCDSMTNIHNITKDCKFDKVDPSHCYDNNMKTVTHSHTIILDDEDARQYSVNEVKEDDLDDTLILNFDDTSEMLTNQDNVKRNVDWNKTHENDLDDIICVEDYHFEKENNEYCNNVASLDPDVIMISPKEVTGQYSDKNNMDMNDQRSVMHEQNIITKNIVTDGSNNNTSYVILDNKEFQNLYEFTNTEAPVKNPCTDIVLNNRTPLVVNRRASHNNALAKENIGRDLYDSTKVLESKVLNNKNQIVENNKAPHSETMCKEVTDHNLYNFTQVEAQTKNPCSDMAQKNRYQLFENDRGYHTKALAIENISPNLYEPAKVDILAKTPCPDIVLKNRNQKVENFRSSLHKTLAIEDIGSNLYQSTKTDAPANNYCSDIVLKNRNQLVENKRASHDKTLAIENIGYYHYESPKAHAPPKTPGSDIALKRWNDIVKNNRAPHDETLEAEDSGLNIRPNETQCNKSICYPSVLNDLYPSYDLMNNSQSKSSHSSKNLEDNKQKADYVKRYTYSTSKIDVCTKQTPEYCVQVIKKVKMDLDITAIVSRKQNSSQNYKSDCEETSSNNKRMKIVELTKQDNPEKSATEDADKMIATVPTVYNENRKISKRNLPSATLFRPELPTVKNVVKLSNYAKGGEESETNNLKIMHKSEGPKVLDTIIHFNKNNSNNDAGKIKIPEIKHKELEQNNNSDYGDTSGKLGESDTQNSPAKGENEIRNVLHKYSKILAKTSVKTVAPSCSGLNKTGTSTTKPQKPFKITDINKLHATLPETIVDNKPEVEKEILQFPKVNRYVEAKKKCNDLSSSQYTECSEMRPFEEIPEHESIAELNLEPIHLPANVDLEPSNDYKIDQSMFDPKTLLQSVADDDSYEIVPPPLQFCDDNAEASMADDTVRSPKQHIFTEEDMEYNESIFDECSATNLTPSTEIETWNLSQEESWEPHNAMKFSPAQSITVMRRNTNNVNFSQNSILSTQGKLGAFRFSQKSKLKIRK